MPKLLPNELPIPDLTALKRDKTGEYALGFFEATVLSALRYDDAGDLLAYLLPPPPTPLDPQEALEQMFQAVMAANGLTGTPTSDPATALKRLLNRCADIARRTHPPPRRPRTKDYTPAVKACIHRTYLQTPWPKVANLFCDCGRQTHDSRCVNTLETAVQVIKAEMKKNGVTLRQLPVGEKILSNGRAVVPLPKKDL
jgi:hypothetical protein